MKKYLFYLSIIIVGLSCAKENLDVQPGNTFSDVTVFDTRTRIEGQVRGMYALMKNAGMYGGRYQIYNDVRGAEFRNERSNPVTGFDVWNYTVTASSTNSVENHWIRAYLIINQVNIFIEGMAAKGTSVVGDELSKNFIGEARLIRALCYNFLLQLYARPYWDGNGSKPGVPLRLTAIKSPGKYAKARNTVAEVYTQILEDLNFAEANLKENNGSAVSNTTRGHKNTAIALKTRVYLSMGRYADVITEANKIVSATAPFKASSGVLHELQPDFATVFTNYTTTESILSMPFDENDAPGTQNQLGFYYGMLATNGGNAEYSLLPTGIVANTDWKTTDRRRIHIFSSGGKLWLTKYGSRTPYIDYAPVIRYAEVLLNLAEARVRLANTVDAQAIELLNAVRKRSDPTTTFTAADFADGAALANALFTERRIEFLGEGVIGADYTRLGLDLPSKPSVAAVPASARNYIWPIPATEMLLNNLMTAN